MQYTVAEYFAGIGLVRLGLERAGWKVVFANDIAPEKYQMYQDAFPDAAQHYRVSDIFDIDPSIVPSTTLATSSFPCIDLSLAGKQNGLEGKHSSAFWGFLRVLKYQVEYGIAPPLVLLENVIGWLTSNHGDDFRLTIRALNDLGYSCDVFTLDALRFTPQSRPRVFVVGAQNRPPSPNAAPLRNRPNSLATQRLKKAVDDNYDLRWAWLDIPNPPPLHHAGLDKIVEAMDEDDPRWWPHAEVERHLLMMADAHRERVLSLKDREEVSYRTLYRRIRFGKQRAEVRKDDIAGCLRTARGGSSRQMVVRAGNGQIRMRHMTAREYARLQGVPDSYPIRVDEIQALNGFGDAVCVPLITWIADNILNVLVKELDSLSLLAKVNS